MGPFAVEPLSQIQPGRVSWLWEPYLARGKLTVLDGDPGVGKSLVMTDVAARLSRGADLPDGTPGGGPTVALLVNAEDDPADTIRPRAEAAGADLERLVVLSGVGGRVPRLPADVPAVEELVRTYGAGLVVLDPLMAFLPPGLSATLDQCVRHALDPLADLAARTGAAVVIVRHLTKDGRPLAVYRGSGTIGIIGKARCGLMIARRPGCPGERVLAVPKCNSAPEGRSVGFRVGADGAGRAVVEWTGPAGVTADELCRVTVPPAPLRPRDRASDWLRGELAAGPRKAAEVMEAAAAAGIPEATLRRAKAELKVESHRVNRADGRGEWYWADPDAPWPADAPFRKPFEFSPLRGLDPL